MHCAITFNVDGSVVVTDLASANGLSVSYDKQAGDEIRTNFDWIIFPSYKKILVGIPGADTSFKMELAEHQNCAYDYYLKREEYLSKIDMPGSSIPATPFGDLTFQSQIATAVASGTATPKTGAILLKGECLGTGGMGEVHVYQDVSTGIFYAGKTFTKGIWELECAILKSQAHVSNLATCPEPYTDLYRKTSLATVDSASCPNHSS